MASQDQLWFELGVRDNVSQTLSQLMKDVDALTSKFADATEMANAYKNIQGVAKTYQEVDEAIRRLNTTRSQTTDRNERKRLSNIIKGLRDYRQKFTDIVNDQDQLGEKGSAAFQRIKTNIDIAISSANKYNSTINRLLSRQSELSGMRNTLTNAINQVGTGVDTAEAKALLRQLTSREGHVANAIKNGYGMPTSASDASMDALHRKMKEVIKTLGIDMVSAEKSAAQAARENAQANQGLVNAYDKVVEASKKQGRVMTELTTLANSYFSLLGAKKIVNDVITIGGQFEIQHVSLQNILGDLQAANTLFEQLKDLALESPMTFSQIAGFTKQLAAFSIPQEELYETTKRLADLSTGLGVDMSRLILAYGQVRSAAVLRGQELRQFTEAGIPLVQRLAEEFTRLNGKVVQTGDVFELISKRKVPFEMVKKVLWDMTDEGGQFYNMQYKIAETLSGKWQKLTDAYQQFLGRLAEGNTVSGKMLKNILTGLIDITNSAERLLPLFTSIMAVFGAKRGYGLLNGLMTANASAVSANIAAAQRQNALEIQREFTLGRINRQRMEELLAQNANMRNTYSILAANGRLSTLQLSGLYIKKQLTAEDLKQMVAEKAITAEQQRQIMSATRLSVLKGTASNFFKGIFTPGNLLSIGLGVAIAGISSYISHLRQAEEETRRFREESLQGAAERLKSSGELLGNLGSPIKESDYVDKIGVMTKYLKENAAGWDNVATASMDTGTNLASLKERYDELAKAVRAVNEANEDIQSDPDMFKRADDASGINWMIGSNDEVSGRLRSAQKYYDKFGQTVRDVLQKDMEGVGNVIEGVLKKYDDFASAVREAGAEKNLARQLEILRQYPEALKDFNSNYINTNGYLSGSARELQESWGAYALQMSYVNQKLEEFSERIKNDMRGRYGADIDFSNLTPREEEFFARSLDTFLQQARITNSKVIEDFKNKLNNQGFNIRMYVSTTEAEQDLIGWKKELDDLTGGKFTAEIKAFSNVTDAVEFFKKTVSEMKKEIETQKPIAIKFGFVLGKDGLFGANSNTKQYTGAFSTPWSTIGKDAADSFNEQTTTVRLIEKYMKSIGVDTSDWQAKGSKKSKSNKTDTKLEEAKTRFDEIKKFYAEYKKFRETMGEEQAKLKVEEIFGIDSSKGDEIINNYKGVLEGVLNGLSLNTEQRKKFATSVRQALADIDLDKVKQDLSRKLQDIQESLSRQAEQWNLYKTLLEKTGDKSLAMSAFSDGVVFDDLANSMADRLRQAMEKNLRQGAPLVIDWDADEQSAEDYFKKNFEDGEVLYKQWQEIVKLLHKNYTDGLSEVATATEKLMSTNEKILKAEAELTELRNKYGANDPRVMVKEKELNDLRVKQFEESEAYLRFYAGILALTTDEAENIGSAIKQNLVDQLATGAINADKFLKSIKNVEQQLATSRNRKSDFLALSTGGLNGYFSNRESRANDSIAADAIKIDAAQKRIDAERKKLQAAHTKGDKEGIMAAQLRIALSELDISLAKERMKQQQTLLINNNKQRESLNKIAGIIDTIAGAIDGAQQAAQQLSDMFDALGHEGSANTWSDIASVIGIVGSPVKSAGNAIKSALSGDIGGVISNAVGMITSPITGIAQLHDKKREREIEKSTQRLKALTTAFGNLQGAMEKALGGIYTSGGYNEMYANLQAQRNELQKQYDLEDDKKKKDKDKLADYEQQLKELDDQIKTYALDMAKSLYDIDLQSWASQLTEAIVGAWEKGEDAVEAYRSKVKDIMKDLTTNILAKKVMERAFDSLGIDELIASIMDASAGKLDANAIPKLAEALGKAGNLTVDTITRTLDEMERQGQIEKESENSSGSSVTNSIKSITENTADLLASYINAIRADVSVNRMTLTEILNAVQNQVEMPVIARAQLERLSAIVENTSRNALAAEQIYSLLSGNINKVNKFNI